MEITEKIRDIITKPITEAGYKLDQVTLEKEDNNLFLRVVIDKEGYINVDDCVTVCHIINPILDEADPIDESYILDVCSKEKGSEYNG